MCPPVHLPLQGFQPIDMTLYGTITPDLFHRVFHGRPIFLQLSYKLADALDACGFRPLYPAPQAGHFATAQNAAKAQHQVTHRGKVGTTELQNLHDLALLAIQLWFRLAQ